ncbi:thiamine biosynthesis protein ThiI [Halanaerobium saccharolyticum]|uniref:Probable tRNA sulfurtransferase n=1 Tax=Halanaerobium saccharolyticum TaxID=43595 RepID=A0A4R7Z107_9FIRM|nr:tRNA uracil 4-sulfurtransferase ThiI [Halanaerobium saccharolyticum]RAK06650.1 thiamine biosynthesis protein ThiI [Halanaerobium saccharolyticum]TDW01189.1 thiamine biosynthesis protein ThiI [Halanaerobium saccharolyticum]TDX51455.1 thiamine biosynthesis protein ThiI [Halanaerobium saccharolyticum]
MYDLIIIRYGEIGLKGDNINDFISQLISNIKRATADLGDFEISTVYGRIFLYAESNQIEKIVARLVNVPGIISLSPAQRFRIGKKIADFNDQDFEKLKNKAVKLFKAEVQNYPTTFKMETTRADKSFPIESPELNRELGGEILREVEGPETPLSVDVHQPEHLFEIEIRRGKIYLFIRREAGPGGLPVKSSGKALLLLSGGIDSPVAGWLGLKRGLSLNAVYFDSPPYTSERAKEKVIDLAKVLSRYGGEIKLQIPYFTEIQQEILKKSPRRYTVTIMRRMMIRIANRLAELNNELALVTGESLGQVASQTLEGLRSSDEVAEFPVLRPLVTMDKNDIIALGKKIGTYEISIRPHEDCCTIFVPDNPATQPKLDTIHFGEEDLEIEKLVNRAVEKMEVITINEGAE